MNSTSSNGENMIRRLMIMLKMLYLGQGLNASELCSEFNLSLRTVQRDIARLKEYCAVDIQKRQRWKILYLTHRIRRWIAKLWGYQNLRQKKWHSRSIPQARHHDDS